MIKRRTRPNLPAGVGIKKRILVEALILIRLLRQKPVTREQVERKTGIPRREFYRYLQALRLAKAPLTRIRTRPAGRPMETRYQYQDGGRK